MRKIHIKYGVGTVLSDEEGMCHKGEVIFRPDGGVTDRSVQPDSRRALSIIAPYDIVNIADLN